MHSVLVLLLAITCGSTQNFEAPHDESFHAPALAPTPTQLPENRECHTELPMVRPYDTKSKCM